MSTLIEFKKVKSLVKGFDYEATGEFKRGVTFIRITKSHKNNEWKLIVFYDGSVQGTLFCECKSLSDGKETSNEYFAL